MQTPDNTQTALLCPACAGQCLYDPTHQGLTCQSCGQHHRIDVSGDQSAIDEFSYDPDEPQTEPPTPSTEQEHQCQTCGGSVLFTGAALSERCPYCDGSLVLAAPTQGYATLALIPFRVPQKIAHQNALDWAKRRIAAPNDLANHLTEGRSAGLYAPFWTFDSDEAVDYWAKYTTGSGDNQRTHSVSGKLKIEFDDLLVPASQHVTPLIRDGILHEFDPERLRSYQAGFLAGFAAERHHQTVAEGLAANEADKALLIRNRIKRHIAKSRVHSIGYLTDSTGIHYRRILLPVWILHYTYGGTAKKIVVSGIDGRTFGERPFSRWKVTAYSAVISAVSIGLGLLWGALGFL